MVCRTLGVWAMVFAVIGVWPRATRAQTSPPKPAASADQPSTRGAAATLDRKISLHLEHVTFKQALDAIAAAGHVQIAYSRTYVSSDKLVTLVVDSITVGDALTVLLRGTQISVTVSPGGLLMLDDAADTAGGGRVLSLTAAAVARTDSGSVTGTITDSVTGAGVRGAIARVDETNQMAMTNANGVFTIAPVAAGKYHVSIRRVGFLPHVRLVVIEGGKQTVVDAILSRQPTKLEEVLTTATGSQRRVEVGNDITTLSADSILNIAPATNLTQLLETRVPGLVVQNTTGIPGAPSRLRLRGVSSIEQSDDPILIVDGIRVYSNQSGSYNQQNGNLTNGGSQVIGRVNTPNGNSSTGNQGYYGPSPIDLIDPNSIESIEVMKGPSAAALYGSDAGNGVIIIKTKRGVAGQTRWNLSGNETIETLPGNWPVNYFRFGHASGLNNTGSQVCSLYDGPQNCTTDSLVAFQALNNPRLSPLGTGSAQEVALGVSGGAGPLTFAAGGDASQTSGILHLPEIEVQRFDKYHPFPAPGWMINPDQYGTWAAHDNLTVQLGHSAGSPSLSMTSSVMKANQQQSSLQTAIAQLENSYIDSTTLASNPLIDEYYERAQLASLKYTNALSLSNWAPVKWLPITATVGLDVYDTYNTSLTPYGYVLNSSDSLGHYAVQQGQNVVATYNLGTTILTKYVNLSTGFNVQSTTTNTLSGFSTQLTPGVSVPQSFACGGSGGCVSDLTSSLSTYGWYIQPALRPFGRLFVNPAVRLDGGNASGANAQISFYPKIDASYLAIDDRNNRAVPWITQLRPRIAFGIAGVQPGPAEKLRLFQTGTVTSLDTNEPVTVVDLNSLGNTKLVPERSNETEGGIDATLFRGRVNVTATGYYKMRFDAILNVPVAPSVGVGNALDLDGIGQQQKNIGTVRNEGMEFTFSAVPWEIGRAHV